tara:strand:+ start:12177 stop:12722 length:546 start_codon:yes stop_codon:yes gene_type:complete
MSYIFTSERIGFRTWSQNDLEPFATLNADEEVMRYFPSTLTSQETASLMERISNHFEKYDYGFFAIDYLPEKKFIGFIGLSHPSFKTDFTPCVEIGWRLDKAYWNMGLATEGAQRCLEFAQQELLLTEVYAFTIPENLASQRVMQKIGMQFAGNFNHPRFEEDSPFSKHVLYNIGSTFINK